MQREFKVGDLVKTSYGYHSGKSIGIIIETESDVCRVAWCCKTKKGALLMKDTHSYTSLYTPGEKNETR